jgi:transcriptional regulator with XRE-family HTH domain
VDLSVNKRLIKYVTAKEIEQKELARELGLTSQQINKWIKLKEQVPDKHIPQIIKIYKDLSARWFITGEGSMNPSDETNGNNGPDQPCPEDCPLCKEKDKRIELLEKIMKDQDKKITEWEKSCADKDELLDWYRGKKKSAPEDRIQKRQASNE